MGRVRFGATGCLLALVACSSGAGRPAPSPPGAATPTAAAAPGAALTAHYWRLLDYAVGGPPVPVVPTSAVRFEDGRFRARACNDLDGTAVLRDGYYEGRTGYAASQMQCHGQEDELELVVAEVLASPRVEWQVAGDQLVLRDEGGRTLRYAAIDAGYPHRSAELDVATGEHEGWRYRLYSQPSTTGIGLGVTLRDPAGGTPRGTGVGEPRHDDPHGGITALSRPIAGAVYVAGFAPKEAVRVTHRPAPGAKETELARYPVVGSAGQAYGGVVARHRTGSVVTAYGRDGRVLARYTKVIATVG